MPKGGQPIGPQAVARRVLREGIGHWLVHQQRQVSGDGAVTESADVPRSGEQARLMARGCRARTCGGGCLDEEAGVRGRQARGDEFTGLVDKPLAQHQAGDPGGWEDTATIDGEHRPVVRRRDIDRAGVALGGKRAREESGGYYVEPTVFHRMDNTHTLAREEVFAEFIESRAHEALLHASSMGSGPTLTRRYLLEPAADDEPYEREGLLRLPLMQDCSDRRFLDAPALTPDAWLQYAIDTFDVLYAESEYATRVYALPVHAHIIGRPGRINALEQILQYASSREHVWVATARDIAEHILAQPDQNLQEAHA